MLNLKHSSLHKSEDISAAIESYEKEYDELLINRNFITNIVW